MESAIIAGILVAAFLSIIVLQHLEIRSYRRFTMALKNDAAFSISNPFPTVQQKVDEVEKKRRMMNAQYDAMILNGTATDEDLKTFEEILPVIN